MAMVRLCNAQSDQAVTICRRRLLYFFQSSDSLIQCDRIIYNSSVLSDSLGR